MTGTRGRIRAEDIALVRERARVEDIIREYVTLKNAGGGSLKGLCPFHDERSPSFHVTPSRGYWHCLAGETRVITREGTFPISELSGKTVPVLGGDGTWVEAPFSSFGVQPLMKITLSRNGKSKVIHATDEHRWFIRNGKNGAGRREVLTKDLKSGDTLISVFPKSRVLNPRSVPSSFGIARGVVYGDGYRQGHGSIAKLCGEKDAALLKYFGDSGTWDRDDFTLVKGLPAYFKDERPSLDEEPMYLLGWLAGYFAADGCVADDGDATMASANYEDLQYVRDLCTRLGIGTFGISTQMRLGFGEEPSAIHTLRLMTQDIPDTFFLISEHRARIEQNRKKYARTRWVVKAVESTDRVEEVFCAEVPETHAFVLEDNILTGNCFGCSEGGDVIDFVQKIDHVDFVEAVTILAERVGVSLNMEDLDPDYLARRSQRMRIVEAHKLAAKFFSSMLSTSEGEIGRIFLTERGFDDAAVAQFDVGYSPKSWDSLTVYLRGMGFKDDELIIAGLAVEGNRGVYDRFRGRLMWPIKDLNGDVIGFGARKLHDSDDGPKYLNTPETPVYKKSTVLYGLNAARRNIAKTQQAVIVEGYTDVMACHLAGVTTAVATCGTAFGEEHVKVLRRLLMDDDQMRGAVVFTFDGDAAGQKAAMRAFELDQRFTANTFVAVEPNGMDPCELRMSGGDDAVRDLIDRKVPLFEFVIRTVIAARDLNRAEERVTALRDAAPVVAQIRDKALRPEYERTVAKLIGLDLSTVQDAVRQAGRGAGQGFTDSQTGGSARSVGSVVQREALKCALQEPGAAEVWYEAVEDTAYPDPLDKAVHEALIAAGGPRAELSGSDWVEAVLEACPDEATQTAVRSLAVEPITVGNTEMTTYAVSVLARLLEMDATRRVDEVKSRMARAEDNPDADITDVFAELLALEEYRRDLKRTAANLSS